MNDSFLSRELVIATNDEHAVMQILITESGKEWVKYNTSGIKPIIDFLNQNRLFRDRHSIPVFRRLRNKGWLDVQNRNDGLWVRLGPKYKLDTHR